MEGINIVGIVFFKDGRMKEFTSLEYARGFVAALRYWGLRFEFHEHNDVYIWSEI